MKDLMSFVEKVVRPVPASMSRKMTMREEMLDHLQEVYHEELAKTEDHHQALQAAITRFGPTEELTQELKSSVPWYDSITQYFSPFPPSWSWPHTTFSLTVWTCAFNMIVLLPVLFFLFYFMPLGPDRYIIWGYVLFGDFTIRLFVYSTAGALSGVLNHRKSKALALLYAITFCGLITALGNWVSLPETPRLSIFLYAGIFTVAMMMISLSVIPYFRKHEAKMTQLKEWEDLELA